jgi:hypothetical protein
MEFQNPTLPEGETAMERLESNTERYQQTDSTDEGRKEHFMTVDQWILDGNPTGETEDFGPEMEQEAPPTLNGKPF